MSNRTYNFFNSKMTREEIRKAYRTLAMQHHPDHGGDLATMQALNAEYDWAMDVATRNEMPGRTEASYDFQAGTNRKIREAVEAALKHTILTVEVTGWWIWVSGTAKRGTSPANDAALDALQKAGYHWHSAKKLWYYAGIPSKNRREWSMDEIRNTYGSKVREGQSESNQSEPEPVKAQRIA